MPHPQCCGIENAFNDKVAKRELKKFRRKGLGKHTARLLTLIRNADKSPASLLDIGGGIGGIQHTLAKEGVARITSIDASPSYLAASRDEAKRQGYTDRVQYFGADFVEVSDQIGEADVVTMDRVLCCYHDVDALLGAAASKTRHVIGLVFPRETFLTRLGVRTVNLINRIRGDEFRAFVHPHTQIDEILKSHELTLSGSRDGVVWRVAVYQKSG